MAAVGIWGPLGWGDPGSVDKITRAFNSTEAYLRPTDEPPTIKVVQELREMAEHFIVSPPRDPNRDRDHNRDPHYTFSHRVTPEDYMVGEGSADIHPVDPGLIGSLVYASRICFPDLDPDELPSSPDYPVTMQFNNIALGLTAVLNQIEVVPSPISEKAIAPVSPAPLPLLVPAS